MKSAEYALGQGQLKAYLGAQNLEHQVLKGFTRNDNEVLYRFNVG
ncbi:MULTISPECIES: hypothetical protein [Myxococcus]|nr:MULTISPECIES: hypothetical protein [Myxococcus]